MTQLTVNSRTKRGNTSDYSSPLYSGKLVKWMKRRFAFSQLMCEHFGELGVCDKCTKPRWHGCKGNCETCRAVCSCNGRL